MIERLISFAAGDGSGYGSLAIEAERGAAMLRWGDREVALPDAAVSRGEGAIRLSPGQAADPETDLILGVSATTSPLAFEAPGGIRAELQGLSVSGEHPDLDPLEGTGIAWSFGFADEPPASLRSLWCAGPGGGLLAGFAARPHDVSDHGSEQVGIVSISRNGQARSYAEPLISTEYDAAGSQMRATLELWGTDEGAIAERGAGRRVAGGEVRLGEATLRAAQFAWRLGGEDGIGGYDIVTG
jgi:hypothetical protein